MAVRLITDSTSDITPAEAQRLGIELIALKVIFGQDTYREGEDIDMAAFYERLTSGKEQPTTSQPAPDDFLTVFERVKAAGDSAVVLTISSTLSGTMQSAVIAREMCGYEDIHIVDSRSAIIGLRLLVEYALRLRAQGMEAAAIAAAVEEARERLRLYAVVDTLEYLCRGGRLSRSAAMVGSLLNVKPLLTLQDGTLNVMGKARGLHAAYAKVVEAIRAGKGVDETCPIYFGYTMTDGKAQALRERLRADLGMDGGMYPVGCVVGAHAGPGACVVTFLEKA